jgi:dihydropyrimidine dehydrogenase (NAD+) subunit PreT
MCFGGLLSEIPSVTVAGSALQELLPPLSEQEAVTESARCLMCFDAPCTHACPTHIDIPKFIKKISTGNLLGSARTILESNLLGATCARVCPVQELCEGACVLGSEHKPIAIGRLQRHAMDYVYGRKMDVFHAGKSIGKKVAVVGAGPAGLSCAGELSKLGVSVTLYEKRELPGGLSTYGIIVLREPVEVALTEVAMIQRLGARIEPGKEVGVDPGVLDLQKNFNAVFIGVGLGNSPELGIPGEEYILDGLRYIEDSKLQPGQLHVGRDVIVIGAGNTAIDCATVARRLGAEGVTMLYRRTEKEMTAYPHEYAFVKLEGVSVSFLSKPVKVHHENGVVKALECVRVALGEVDASGRAAPKEIPGSNALLPADQIVKAIGQNKLSLASQLALKTERGFISVDANFETSAPGVFAGGDCIRARGSASTVMAVQDGKLAARAIYQRLKNHG